MIVDVTRTYRYRLLPSRAQAAMLFSWLRLTRELYNAALQERRDAWAKQRVSISRYDQQAQIKYVRVDRPDVATVPVAALRGAIHRIDNAFAAFFRRCKAGKKPGYPRFKSARRWDTIEFDTPIVRPPVVAGGKRVKIPLLGKVKFRQHRPIEGRPRSMKIKFDSDGKWYVCIACDGVATKPLPATGRTVGVDLGLLTFAATSDGELFANPRPLAAARIAKERAQRRVTRRKRGGYRRRQAVRMLAKCHAHVANVRREQHIVLARSLVARYDTIVVEDLNIRGLARGWLAKSVADAGWGEALGWLACKAEEAGRELVRVNPAGTSKSCSRCGVMKEALSLGERVFRCEACGFVVDRDVNAACNIKGAGMLLRGGTALVKARRRSANRATTAHRPGHARPLGTSGA